MHHSRSYQIPRFCQLAFLRLRFYKTSVTGPLAVMKITLAIISVSSLVAHCVLLWNPSYRLVFLCAQNRCPECERRERISRRSPARVHQYPSGSPCDGSQPSSHFYSCFLSCFRVSLPCSSTSLPVWSSPRPRHPWARHLTTSTNRNPIPLSLTTLIL